MDSIKSLCSQISKESKCPLCKGSFHMDECQKCGYKSVLIPKAFVSWRKGGVSDTQKEIVRQENIQVVSRNTGLTLKEAEKYYTRKYLPKKILWSLETKIADFPETFGSLLKHNRKQFFKYIRKQLLTVHLRKGKRCFRLFGITFYNKGKK